MHHRSSRTLILALAVTALVALTGTSAAADVNTVTQAQARFNLIQGFNCAPQFQVLPDCGDVQRARLRLLGDIPEQHYCADDWHVANVRDAEDATTGGTNRGIKALLDKFDATISIDGRALDVIRTNNRRIDDAVAINGGLVPPAWQTDVGALLAPDALAVGEHTSHIEFTLNNGVDPPTSVDRVFIIDATGTGACLGP